MKNKNFTIGIGITIILLFLVFSGWVLMKPQPMILQGEVEATQIKVASKLVGRINSILVKEGQKVDKDALLIEINSPEVEAKLKQAKAAKNAALAQSNKAKKGARSEQISAARTMWLKAEAAADFAKKSFERVNNLYKEGVIAAQKKDEVETKMKAAQLTAEAAKSQYDMAMKGARVEDKAAALALVDRASGAISEVESYIKEKQLSAPISGEIASINAEQGELITPGFPVVNIVDLNDIWITINIREDFLSKFKMGTEFQAKLPALDNKVVKFKVNYISSLGGFATWRATKTAGDFDMKTFEVRAVPVENVSGMRPGMSVLVNWDDLK
jgi:HlyD family secretion protein